MAVRQLHHHDIAKIDSSAPTREQHETLAGTRLRQEVRQVHLSVVWRVLLVGNKRKEATEPLNFKSLYRCQVYIRN